MKNICGLFFGMIAGLLGAAIWAAIAVYANLEIGYIAWGIGAAIGFAASLGMQNRGAIPAVIAVLVTIVALCGGKYATVSLAINNELTNIIFEDSDILTQIANEIAAEKEAAGEKVAWRNGTNYETASGLADFPREIREQSRAKWSSFSEEEKSSYKAKLSQEWADAVAPFQDEITANAFVASFGFYDLLFFGLGIFTAARLAYADEADGNQGNQESDDSSNSGDPLFGQRTTMGR